MSIIKHSLLFLLLLFFSCKEENNNNKNSISDLPPPNIFLVIHKEGKYANGILSEKKVPLKDNLKIYVLREQKRENLNFNLNKMTDAKDSIFDININQQNIKSFVNKGLTNIYIEKSNQEIDTLSIDINNNNGKNILHYIKTISYNGKKIPLLNDELGDNTFVYYLK